MVGLNEAVAEAARRGVDGGLNGRPICAAKADCEEGTVQILAVCDLHRFDHDAQAIIPCSLLSVSEGGSMQVLVCSCSLDHDTRRQVWPKGKAASLLQGYWYGRRARWGVSMKQAHPFVQGASRAKMTGRHF